MRPHIIFILIFLIFFVPSCTIDKKTSALHKACVINADVITSNIDGIDSLMVVKADNTDLFKIALGGNTELLSDTVINIDDNSINLIALADYFQDNQIFTCYLILLTIRHIKQKGCIYLIWGWIYLSTSSLIPSQLQVIHYM